MMLLDVAAPDFAVVDAWAPVADGPFGVMGCRRPAQVRHVYAGADVLAVDEVVLADLGIDDPRRAPIVRRAHHWFGLPLSDPVVDGSRPCLHDELRGAHRSAALRALGSLSYPVYVYLSNHGEVFVPEMDTVAFPPSGRVGRDQGRGQLGLPASVRAPRPGRLMRRPPGASGRSTRPLVSKAFGLLAALGGRHPTATVLAIADSRRLVRASYLSSAAESGLLRLLSNAATPAELAVECGAARTDRLEAWLAVGVELGELARRGNRYQVVGRRARALRDGDPLLTAHYRSMLEYQVGPYRDLRELLSQAPSTGRDDLGTHPRTIAEVSLAAAPFVVPFLRRAVGTARPVSALDVGCGTGVYLRALLEADPLIRVEGIELSPEVATATAAGLVADGLADRATVHSGDVSEYGCPFGGALRARHVVQQHLLLRS